MVADASSSIKESFFLSSFLWGSSSPVLYFSLPSLSLLLSVFNFYHYLTDCPMASFGMIKVLPGLSFNGECLLLGP